VTQGHEEAGESQEPIVLPSVVASSMVKKLPMTIALLIGVIAVAFEQFAVNTAMPAVFDELGHERLFAWGFSAFMIGQVFAIVVGGRWCDRRGAFYPLSAGLFVFAFGVTMAATAPHIGPFLFARFVQGLGGGMLSVALMVVIAEAYGERQRATMMTVFSLCFLLPAFVGPIVAGKLAETLGWRWVFWAILPVIGASIALGAKPVWGIYGKRRIVRAEKNPVPTWAAAFAAVGVTALQWAGQNLGRRHVPATLFILALGIAVLVVAVPKLMPANFHRLGRGLPAVIGVRFLLQGSFAAAQAFMVKLLEDQRGMQLSEAGMSLTMGAAGYAVGAFLQSRNWLPLRRDQVIGGGTAFAAIGLGLISGYAFMTVDHYWVLVVGIMMCGLGMGMAVASTSLAVITLSQTGEVGRNTSSLQVADGLGSAFVAGLGGTVFAALHSRSSLEITYGSVYLVQVLFVVLAIGLSLRIGAVRNESSGAA
jgi:MFS family permease